MSRKKKQSSPKANQSRQKTKQKHEWTIVEKIEVSIAAVTLLLALISFAVDHWDNVKINKIILAGSNIAQNSINETKTSIVKVVLPDSIENEAEVKQIRALQYNIQQFEIAYHSLFEDVITQEKQQNNSFKELEFKAYIVSYIQQLTLFEQEIIKQTMNVFRYSKVENDALTILSFHAIPFEETRKVQSHFTGLLNEMVVKLEKPENQKMKTYIKIIKEMIADKRFIDDFKILHSMNMRILDTTNQRLLTIKRSYIAT